MVAYPKAKGITVQPLDISDSAWPRISLAIATWVQAGDRRYVYATLKDNSMVDLSCQPLDVIERMAGELTHVALVDMNNLDEI